MTRKRLVAGNWKLNASAGMCRELVGGILEAMPSLENVDVAVFPPAPYLSLVKELAGGSKLKWGAQDVSIHEEGAYTGEVSAAMLEELGCTYVLCGHSERRAYHHEDDQLVAEKAAAAWARARVPIVCVGETLKQRESGETEAVVGRQVDAVLKRLGIDEIDQLIIAYEPVWAIGTGKTATPEQAQAVHSFIRSKIAAQDDTIAGRLRILYGGSVKGSNAAELFAMPDIDGGLIGGASLKADEFLAICRAGNSAE